jgi:hypothetical protein
MAQPIAVWSLMIMTFYVVNASIDAKYMYIIVQPVIQGEGGSSEASPGVWGFSPRKERSNEGNSVILRSLVTIIVDLERCHFRVLQSIQ